MTAARRAAGLRDCADDLLAIWSTRTLTTMDPQPDTTPMASDLSATPWQQLEEMADGLDAELAGVEASAGLIAIWHLHAAARHAGDAKAATLAGDGSMARAAEGQAAQRATVALIANDLRTGSAAALRRMAQ